MTNNIYSDFISRYVWKKLGPFDGFRILKGDGPVYGDCRNFALTIAWLSSGRSVFQMLLNMLVGNTVLWFCWNKGLHMSVWDHDEGWICSIHRSWLQKSPNVRIMPLHPIVFVVAFILSLI